MPATALKHFEEDIARASAIVAHANPLPRTTREERMLRSDLLRSAWMFAVGAMDAYFCDAYTDIVAATLTSKSRDKNNVNLPEFFYDIRLPVRAILEPYTTRENWRWRMAARKMMERDNVLKLAVVQTLFNKFFENRKFFRDVMSDWIVHPAAQKRLFGITSTVFQALPPGRQRQDVIKSAKERMEKRYRALFQRRHDCIHNCDRPKVAPQALKSSKTVLKVIQDAEFLVYRCDEHINVEFREFLLGIGCPLNIIIQVGY